MQSFSIDRKRKQTTNSQDNKGSKKGKIANSMELVQIIANRLFFKARDYSKIPNLLSQAYDLFLRSSELGNGNASLELCKIHGKGLYDQKRSWKTCLKYLEEAFKQGMNKYAFDLYLLYSKTRKIDAFDDDASSEFVILENPEKAFGFIGEIDKVIPSMAWYFYARSLCYGIGCKANLPQALFYVSKYKAELALDEQTQIPDSLHSKLNQMCDQLTKQVNFISLRVVDLLIIQKRIRKSGKLLSQAIPKNVFNLIISYYLDILYKEFTLIEDKNRIWEELIPSLPYIYYQPEDTNRFQN